MLVISLLLFAQPLAPNQVEYQSFLARVEKGEELIAHVNQPKRPDQQGVAISWPGEKPGVYRCYKNAAGKAMMEPVATPGVSPAPTFRKPAHVGIHAGHGCPGTRLVRSGEGYREVPCGASQFVISGWNRDGTHNHRCSSCGTTWRH